MLTPAYHNSLTTNEENAQIEESKIKQAIEMLNYSYLNSKFQIRIANGQTKFFTDHTPESFRNACEAHINELLPRGKIHNPGLLIIGECHEDISPKKFLIENMEALANNGYKFIYMEHLWHGKLHDTAKQEVTTWLEALNSGHMMNFFTDYEEDMRLIDKFNFLTLVNTANKCGIKIIPLDCSFSYAAKSSAYYSDDDDNCRQLAFSSHASSVIYNTQGNQKAIAFIGNTHVFSFQNVPGLADIFQSNPLYITDTQEEEKYSLATNSSPSESLLPGYSLEINPNAVVESQSYDDILNQVINSYKGKAAAKV